MTDTDEDVLLRRRGFDRHDGATSVVVDEIRRARERQPLAGDLAGCDAQDVVGADDPEAHHSADGDRHQSDEGSQDPGSHT
jgi:hypothetical protein